MCLPVVMESILIDKQRETHLVDVRQVNDDTRVVNGLVGFGLVVRDNFRSVPQAHQLQSMQNKFN